MGLRVGTPAVTTRGLVESDMDIIADMIVDALRLRREKASIIERVAEIVSAILYI